VCVCVCVCVCGAERYKQEKTDSEGVCLGLFEKKG